MKLIIDRFEGDFAVVEAEDGKTYNVPKGLFHCCSEGDVLNLEFDEEETKKRRENVKNLMNKLFK